MQKIVATFVPREEHLKINFEFKLWVYKPFNPDYDKTESVDNYLISFSSKKMFEYSPVYLKH